MTQAKRSSAAEPMAVIGMGCIFPQSENLQEYWSLIKNRVDAMTDVPESHWKPEDYFDQDPKAPDMTYARRGGFLPTMDFNPMEFAISPNALEGTDTSQLLGLWVAKKAFEDAGCKLEEETVRDRTSVILGITGAQELVVSLGARLGHPRWRAALRDAGVEEAAAEAVIQNISGSYVSWQESSFPGLLGNVVAGRIANYFDLGGTNCVTDTACASSLTALHLASLELSAGRSDLVLSGGADTFNNIFMFMCFSKTPALSPSGNIRPFDHRADGTMLGEGIGMLVLKRLEDAERDGDRIYAVIRGVGASSDGKGVAVFAPKAEGQVKAMQRAYEVSEMDPRTVELAEAHGTGTRAGDAAELTSITKVFGSASRDKAWCALGSIKSNIGHTKAAAGSAGLIKAVLALYHKVLPPTINVEKPVEEIASGRTPFYVNTEKRPWLPREEHPRRAAVSSFGFGGSNFHCVLEEYNKEKTAIDWDGNVQIIAFSADNVEGLKEKLSSFPASLPWRELRLKAEESRAAFDPSQAVRLTLVIEKDRSNLSKMISLSKTMLDKNAGKRSWNTPDGICFGSGPAQGKLGVLFPGQGSQYVGMLGDLACQFPQMFNVLSDANRAFESHKAAGLERRLTDYIYPIPVFTEEDRKQNEKSLHDTRVAQTALGAVSLGALKVLEYFGVRPQVFAGHSFGELTALCAVGCVPAEQLPVLAALRGRLMAEQEGDLGSMLAVQLDPASVEEAVRKNKLELVLANQNSPRQVVLSGATKEVDRAARVFDELKVKNTRIMVSAAFHTPLVSKAQAPFAAALEKIKFAKACVPVFSNTTGKEYPSDPALTRKLLAGQLAEPVRFMDEIKNMYEAGVRTFLEVGPKYTLTNLAKDILGEVSDCECVSLDASRGEKNGTFDLARALAQLAALGQEVKLSLWNPLPEKVKAELKKAKPKMTVPICGANYVRPEPKTGGRAMPKPKAAAAPDKPALIEALKVTQQNIQALQNIQEQTAKLHQQFLENQQSALQTFQALAQQQQQMLGASPGTPVKLPEIKIEMPKPQPIVAAPLPTPVPEARIKVAAPPAKPAASADAERVAKTLVDIISEKTGYPPEMLELDMNLDADLGIDSIKRVEILSALKEKVPAAGAIKAEHMGTLKTLRNITDFIGGSDQVSSPAPAVSAPVPAAPAGDNGNVSRILVELVSEKTGYPSEMLEMDMNLDADLGIDSIKRVEILSALKEKVPAAGAIKTEHMGTLKTLNDIVGFVAKLGGEQVSAASAAAAEIPKAVAEVAAAGAAVGEAMVGAAAQAMGAAASMLQTVLPKEPEKAVPASGLKRLVLYTHKLARERKERVNVPAGAEIWIADYGSLSQKIDKKLIAAGYRTRIVSLDDLPGEAPSSLGGLVIVSPTKKTKDELLKNSFSLLRLAAPGLRAAAKESGAFFATVSRLGGSFGLKGLDKKAQPLSGGLAGLSKTASHEWPEVSCKALDIGEMDDAADQIVDELFIKGPTEVGITDEGRVTVELSSVAIEPDNEYPLKEGDVLLVSGGARGVTAECAVKFAEKRPTLVLLGRSKEPFPEPEWLKPLMSEAEIKKQIMLRAGKKVSPKEIGEEYRKLMANREMLDTFSRIRSAGAKAVYRPVDVRDEKSVKKMLDGIRSEIGPIKGLVHGAGVIADKLIEEKTDEEFDRVYGTKVMGLRNLLKALSKEELRIMVLFSSSTGRYGRTGQVDYAVANEVLNKVAQEQARQKPSCRVVSVNWGPWDGGMVTPSLKKVFENEGVGVIPLEAGAEYLLQEVSSAGPVEVVVQGDLPGKKAKNVNIIVPSLTPSLERDLSVEEYPVLRSHVIDGKAVLPVALMIELLAHGAIHGNPGLFFQGFNDLRVLKGVRLGSRESWRMRVLSGKAARKNGSFVVPVELSTYLNGDKFRNARAEVLLSSTPTNGKRLASKLELPASQKLNGNLYQILFHGPDLQAIEKLNGCSKQGIAATVRTAPKPAAWMRRPLRSSWITDPLALDGSFQMMVLWSYENQGAVSLPTYAGSYEQFSPFPKDKVMASAQVTESSKNKALANIEFADGQGNLVARMENYECVIDPALTRAFTRNQLA